MHLVPGDLHVQIWILLDADSLLIISVYDESQNAMTTGQARKDPSKIEVEIHPLLQIISLLMKESQEKV